MENITSKEMTLRIDYFLGRIGKSRQDLARAVGITPGAISHWGNRGIFPTVDVLYRISIYLNVTIDDLLSNEIPTQERYLKSILVTKFEALELKDKETVLSLVDSLYERSIKK